MTTGQLVIRRDHRAADNNMILRTVPVLLAIPRIIAHALVPVPARIVSVGRALGLPSGVRACHPGD